MSQRRVLCVEDQQTLADALRLAVTAEPDLICLGTARTAEEAAQLASADHPDVVLMDVMLPGDLDGIDATRRMKALSPDIRVVILTASPSLDLVARATAAGADGFLAKDAPLESVLEAIRSSGDGEMRLDTSTVTAITHRAGRLAQPAIELTPRELEVLGHLVDGVGVQAMAPRLGISVHTCREYVRAVLTKLGAHSQLEAVALARRLGVASGGRGRSSTPSD
jgi:DNA-binding NarL/FixJ family response regulator